MQQPITYRPPQLAAPKRCRGKSGTAASPGIPHGTTVVLATVELYKNLWPVLESLYYDGDAAGNGYLRFRCKVDGRQLPYDWADSYAPLGSAGNPVPVGENLPPGRKFTVECTNEHDSDDSLAAYSDGEVCFYEKPIG